MRALCSRTGGQTSLFSPLLGLTIGYESAALVSALGKMRDEGQVADGEKVLLLFTATHLIPLGQRVP